MTHPRQSITFKNYRENKNLINKHIDFGNHDAAIHGLKKLAGHQLAADQQKYIYSKLFFCYLHIGEFAQAEKILKKYFNQNDFETKMNVALYQALTTTTQQDDQLIFPKCYSFRVYALSKVENKLLKDRYLNKLIQIEAILLARRGQYEKMTNLILNNKIQQPPQSRLAQLALAAPHLAPDSSEYAAIQLEIADLIKQYANHIIPDLYLFSARLLRNQGKHEEAMAAYKQAIEKFPTYWAAQLEYAYFLSAYCQSYRASNHVCRNILKDQKSIAESNAKIQPAQLYHLHQIMQRNHLEISETLNESRDRKNHPRVANLHSKLAVKIMDDYNKKYKSDRANPAQIWYSNEARFLLWGVQYENWSNNYQTGLRIFEANTAETSAKNHGKPDHSLQANPIGLSFLRSSVTGWYSLWNDRIPAKPTVIHPSPSNSPRLQ